MASVSFLIPIYDPNPAWLRRCIQSCQNQTYKDWEAVLVNDGSTNPRIWENLVNYSELDKRLHCYDIRHGGVALALNYGLMFCRGKYIARIDADDWNEPKRLEEQLKFLESKNLDICGSGAFFHDGSRVVEKYPPQGEIRELLSKNIMPIWHPSWFFKKGLFEKYEEDFPHAEDFAILCSIHKGLKWGNCSMPLIHKNQHDKRISRIYRDAQKESAKHAITEFLGG